MATKHSSFRENPARSIFLTGEINQAMVEILTPEILRLQWTGNEPITVYIDSPGGSTYHARLLIELLRRRNQDGVLCQIVTVVTGLAASAAADILAAGDYAISYRHAIIHFHGVRTNRGDMTHESASSIAEALRQTNEGYALDLAEQILSRFMFVYMQLQSDVSILRAEQQNLSDVECLASCMASKLGGFSALLQLAVDKHKQTQELLEYYRGRLTAHKGEFLRPALREAFLLQSLIDWELNKNGAQDWSFRLDGLNAIREDFVLLADYENGKHMSNLEQLSRPWGKFLLDIDLQAGYNACSADEKPLYISQHTKERFRQVWHFLVSICRALQQGENQLSAHDAYWLGLINEIPGTSLTSIREIIESQDIADKPKRTSTRKGPAKNNKVYKESL